MTTPSSPRLPLPPFARETAAQKVRHAQDAWNTRDPQRVALAYTVDTVWRNRAEFPVGREQVPVALGPCRARRGRGGRPARQGLAAARADGSGERVNRRVCGDRRAARRRRIVRVPHELARQAVLQAMAPTRAISLNLLVLQALLESDATRIATRLVVNAETAGDVIALRHWAPVAALEAAVRGAHWARALAHCGPSAERTALLDPSAEDVHMSVGLDESIVVRSEAKRRGCGARTGGRTTRRCRWRGSR